MPVPQNMFADIPNDELVTATGGATVTAEIQTKQLHQLQHILSDVASSQQNNNSSNNNLTFAMVAALAMRNR